MKTEVPGKLSEAEKDAIWQEYARVVHVAEKLVGPRAVAVANPLRAWHCRFEDDGGRTLATVETSTWPGGYSIRLELHRRVT